MSNEWNLHVNSLQTRLSDLQSTIDSIKSCVERRPGLDAATAAICALVEASTQNEAALPEFPTALSRILQDPEIGALLVGPHGDIVLFNMAAENLLGRDYLQDKSTSSQSITFSVADKTRRLNADELPWSRSLRGEALPDMRMHVARSNAPEAWLNVSATPFRNSSGAVTGAVIFLIDTTEEVQLETSISTLCNTIHDQIAQVGSTHTQLRDLADKLSNTGLQRIVADASPSGAPSRPEEDPNRKKPQPRRDESVGQAAPSATRNENVVAPKGQAASEESSRVIVPPAPSKAAPAAEQLDEIPVAETPEEAPAAESAAESAVELPPAPPKPAFLEEKPDKPEALRKAPFPMQPSGLASDDDDSDAEPAFVPEELEAELEKIEEEVLEDSHADDANNDKEGEFSPYSQLDSTDYEAKFAKPEDTAGSSDFWVAGLDKANVNPDVSATRSTEGDEVVDSAKSLFGKFANLTKDSYGDGAQKSEKEPDPALPWPELVDGQDYGEPLWEEYTQSEEDVTTPWQKEKVDEPGEDPVPSPRAASKPRTGSKSRPVEDLDAPEPEHSGSATDEHTDLQPINISQAAEGADEEEPVHAEVDAEPVAADEEPAAAETVVEVEEEIVSSVDEPVAAVEEETVAAEEPTAAVEPAEEERRRIRPYAAEQAEDDFEPLPEASGEFARLEADSYRRNSNEFDRIETISGTKYDAVRDVDADSEPVSAVEEIEVDSYVEPLDSNLPAEDLTEPESDVPDYSSFARPAAEAASEETAEEQVTPAVEEVEETIPESRAVEPATQEPTAQDAEPAARPGSLKDSIGRKAKNSSSYSKLKPLGAASDLDGSFLDEGLSGGESLVVDYSSSSSADSFAPVEAPHRVLVVDDIPVNQKLLLLHLKRLGYEADVASNGQEALDMLAKHEYELILMDCDMPVMSGFEASSRIRSNEAYSHRRIPIIALTSYDREGDKEKCIAAGMDDYITKGASQKELKETIERSIVSAQQKSGEGLPASELDAETDLAPLDISAMLKLYGREEVEEISRLFLSNMGTYIECMQLAIDEKNSDSVIHFANAVKGPCAALGMRLMTRLTTDIMSYAEAQDWTQVRVKYMRLKAVFVQTREELKKVCPDDSLLAT